MMLIATRLPAFRGVLMRVCGSPFCGPLPFKKVIQYTLKESESFLAAMNVDVFPGQ